MIGRRSPRKRFRHPLSLDERIVASWRLHEEEDPDISTERLMAMVEDDTGADYTRQIMALERAGILQPKEDK